MSRGSPVQTAIRNCTRDEGRSFEAGSQVTASNRCKLLSSKAMVVSVAVNVGRISRRVRLREASASEPPMNRKSRPTPRDGRRSHETRFAAIVRPTGAPKLFPQGAVPRRDGVVFGELHNVEPVSGRSRSLVVVRAMSVTARGLGEPRHYGAEGAAGKR